MKKVTVESSKRYDILIERGLLGETGARLRELFGPRRAALVSDSTVWKLYGEAVEKGLKDADFQVSPFVFPAGESFKSVHTWALLLEHLAREELTRTDVLVALGGGVTGDLAGFAAASYLRGIPFVQIPTTFLAAIDSSVGGKTAVNLEAGKNLAGAFYQPSLVLCDPDTLETLPEETFGDGVAEAVKYGVLSDPELFGLLGAGELEDRLEDVILRCVESKRGFVLADERDLGQRQLLNFGHTIGHAVEQCSGLTITHGHAVGIGMVMMARGAWRLGLTERDLSGEIGRVLERYRLPTRCEYAPEDLYLAARHDKKRGGGEITIVVPEKIGCCRRVKLPVEQLLRLLRLGAER